MSNWDIKASNVAKNTSNPIRKIVDQLARPKDHPKRFVALSIGDPTTCGNLLPPNEAIEAISDQLKSHKSDGYPPSAGMPPAREAVAKKFSVKEHALTPNDVFLTSGASHGLEMCINVLLNEGDSLLVPAPGFSLYNTLCDARSFKVKQYKLLPEKNWEVDLAQLESLIDNTTKAILVNNPSNPCGSVYSADHLKAIIAVAEKHHLPIISDEIYANMAFPGHEFTMMADLTTTVPILSVGGIAKQYVAPGWRLGWVIVYDKQGYFKEVRDGLLALTTLILGPNSLIQSALPKILLETSDEYYTKLNVTLAEQAKFLFDEISKVEGLTPVLPQGAMYLMVGVDERMGDDVKFSRDLLQEENLMVLPGEVFNAPGFFRLVITPPKEDLQEAVDRIKCFCERRLAEPAAKRAKQN